MAIVLIAALSVASGCVRRVVEPSAGGVVVRSARVGWYTKKVVAKRPPETLLADDGTICRVSAERFAATPTGSALPCNWQ